MTVVIAVSEMLEKPALQSAWLLDGSCDVRDWGAVEAERLCSGRPLAAPLPQGGF